MIHNIHEKPQSKNASTNTFLESPLLQENSISFQQVAHSDLTGFSGRIWDHSKLTQHALFQVGYVCVRVCEWACMSPSSETDYERYSFGARRAIQWISPVATYSDDNCVHSWSALEWKSLMLVQGVRSKPSQEIQTQQRHRYSPYGLKYIIWW